jgi:hypothetical protein
MKTSVLPLRWIAPSLVTLFLSGPALAAAGLPESAVPITAPAAPAAPAAQSHPAKPLPARTTAPSTTPQQADDSARYSQREQQAQGLQDFKGGEGFSLYVGSSVLAVALLVVLILVLI